MTENLDSIYELIRDVPNFPKPGVTFKDITPIFENPKSFVTLAKSLNHFLPKNTEVLAAIESRGFILASAMAQHVPRKVVLLRKPGKLPRQTHSIDYDLEYGTDTLEVHKDSVQPGEPYCIVDDILATGGTASASEKLIQKAGGKVLGHVFLLELEFLKAHEKLTSPYKSLFKC